MEKKIDWSKVKHGAWFRADIAGREAIGRISKPKDWKRTGDYPRIFLCQCIRRYGAVADDRLGFPCSWMMDGNVGGLEILGKKPRGFVIPMLIGHYYVTFHAGHIMVGCTKVPNALVRKIASKLRNK